MAIFAIGDLHLSHGVEKPMDVFRGWERYMERIEENWLRLVTEEDTVLLVGDTSWGMTMEESIPDFLFIDRLPGNKIVLKGNHDYWWGSVTSMHKVLDQHQITSIQFLHNNHYLVEGIALCGSRGWLFENGAAQDQKIVRREGIRLENSLQSVQAPFNEKVVFLHYPPIYGGQEITEYLDILKEHGVTRCYYGHIHGEGHKFAITQPYQGIEFHMISADYLEFAPMKIH